MKKIITLLLVLIMATAFVAGCAPEKTDTEGTTAAQTTSSLTPGTEATETTEFNALNVLGAKDFGGDTITFYSRSYNGMWTSDLLSDGNSGETVPNAIYERNLAIEEAYKIKLEEIASGTQSFATEAYNRIASGDNTFDVLVTSIRDAATLSVKGVLKNLYGDVPNLSLDESWWSPFISEQLSIAGKLYYATGEITTVDNMAVRCIYFNKQIAEDRALPDLYKMVENNTWTCEQLLTMASAAGEDLNGDGLRVIGVDRIGLLAENTLGFMLLSGTGERMTSKDADGIPYISIGNDRSIQIIDFLTGKISDDPAIMTDSVVTDNFMNGNILFITAVLSRVEYMRGSDVEFGILPMPKYDANQQEYVCVSDAYCPNAFSLPVTNIDRLEETTFLLEALAIESVNTVTPAYYDICLKAKGARDEQSSGMIDIVLGNYNIDLADAFLSSWSSFRTTIQNAIKDGESITSKLKSSQKVVEKMIAATVKAYQDNAD